ncbi:hypothetical protein SV7mr_27900 [Stieleria bergensis]|uniref:Uncharacterized protein n=1 Tax=Stieleria bergensis TaxID=2528025 RepID=A0A517SVX5_9BACT|nr:hypothetical protein SV7mr_27900 [Planctomycetes bacterium SV_7m_r]
MKGGTERTLRSPHFFIAAWLCKCLALQAPGTAQRAGGHGGFRCRVVNIKSLAMLVAADGIDGEIFDRSPDTKPQQYNCKPAHWATPNNHTTPQQTGSTL